MQELEVSITVLLVSAGSWKRRRGRDGPDDK